MRNTIPSHIPIMCDPTVDREHLILRDRNRNGALMSTNNHANASTIITEEENDVTLSIGELPGYTGWARPEHTLVAHYHIQSTSASPVVVRKTWYTDVQCSHTECSNGGAQFFIRAYGPAVITGTVTDRKDGSYRIEVKPHDPGTYYLEVVLTSSVSRPWFDYPLKNNQTDPLYEGHLLPGFPLRMVVQRRAEDDSMNTSKKTWCAFEQLVEENSTSGLNKGRWLLADTVRSRSHTPVTPEGSISLRGYQFGVNSLGVSMQYVPADCNLLSFAQFGASHIADKCIADMGTIGNHSVHIIFVGDSVMKLQYESFEMLRAPAKTRTIRTSFITMKGGIVLNLNILKDTLRSIHTMNPNEQRMILFNSGLHDSDRMCCSDFRFTRFKYNLTTDDYVCLDLYREKMMDLVDFMSTYPADLKVFRSTTAGWQRYGNFGFSWDPTKPQRITQSPHMVEQMNNVMFDVIAKNNKNIDQSSDDQKIHIMDGYWISLPRPDNTEAGIQNRIGKHLVHPGPEVVWAMSRLWWMAVLRFLCSNMIDNLT